MISEIPQIIPGNEMTIPKRKYVKKVFPLIEDLNALQFNSLMNIIKQSAEKASGEIYCFADRKQKKSAQYARKALREIVKAANQLRSMLQAAKNAMVIKKKAAKTL
jgi:hypothetical protein